jgi:hypothetical protein
MNRTRELVDDRYLKVLIVAQAVVAEVLSELSAGLDGLQVSCEVDPDPVSHRDAILMSKKNFCIAIPQIASRTENRQCGPRLQEKACRNSFQRMAMAAQSPRH